MQLSVQTQSCAVHIEDSLIVVTVVLKLFPTIEGVQFPTMSPKVIIRYPKDIMSAILTKDTSRTLVPNVQTGDSDR